MPENELTYIYESDLEELNRLPEHIDEIIEHFNLTEELNPLLMLALSEGVTNGIKHGNKYSEDKKVTLHCELETPSVLKCTVTDEGDGFDPESVPDPLAEENLLKPSGRGVYLMKEYAKNVNYNDKGNQLIVRFNV